MDVQSLLSDAGLSVGALTFNIILRALLIFLVGLVFIRVLLSLLDRAVGRSKSLANLRTQIHSTVNVLLVVLLIFVVLDSIGVKITSFVALLSVAGLAVSLALQNALSNVAGGIMLLTAQPFAIGDYVQVDGVEGTVEMMGISFCKLTTIDNKQIQIPNSQIAATKIINFNRLGRRRVDLTFTASYDSPTQAVKDAIRSAMSAFPQILRDPAPEVYLAEYGASSISYLARMWVKADDYWTVYFGMLEQVRESYAEKGVQMSYEHVNVHMVKD